MLRTVLQPILQRLALRHSTFTPREVRSLLLPLALSFPPSLSISLRALIPVPPLSAHLLCVPVCLSFSLCPYVSICFPTPWCLCLSIPLSLLHSLSIYVYLGRFLDDYLLTERERDIRSKAKPSWYSDLSNRKWEGSYVHLQKPSIIRGLLICKQLLVCDPPSLSPSHTLSRRDQRSPGSMHWIFTQCPLPSELTSLCQWSILLCFKIDLI